MRENATATGASRLLAGDYKALDHLRRAVLSGTHWYVAILEAIALWESAEESRRDVVYRYVIAEEAFDWLRLAERLADEIADFIPAAELEALLFRGIPPVLMGDQEFRRTIGAAKHRAHLNFFYGVVVEEALLLAAEEEVAKELRCGSLTGNRQGREDAYQRVYGISQAELLARFRQEQGRGLTEALSLDDYHEFTYWLFRFRLKWTDKARVASDTKKGLMKLEHARSRLPAVFPQPDETDLPFA